MDVKIKIQPSFYSYLLLFQIIHELNILYDTLYIHVPRNYFNELNTLYKNYQNVVFYIEDNLNNTHIKEIDLLPYTSKQECLTLQCLQGMLNIEHINQTSMLFRNRHKEYLLYMYFIKNIQSDYIFYYNKNNPKYIQYFGNTYIFDFFQNFYTCHHPFYSIWKKLNIQNLTHVYKIVEHAHELHIFEEDFLFLILEADIHHIKNKYFYVKGDYFSKEEDIRLKDWSIIYF